MPTKGKDLVKEALKDGWVLDRINGSHHVLKRGSRTVTIPVHGSKELGTGLEKKIRKELKK